MVAKSEFIACASAGLTPTDYEQLMGLIDLMERCPYATLGEGGSSEPGVTLVVDLPFAGISKDHVLVGVAWKKKEEQLSAWLQFRGHDIDSQLLEELRCIAGVQPSSNWRGIKRDSPGKLMETVEQLLAHIETCFCGTAPPQKTMVADGEVPTGIFAGGTEGCAGLRDVPVADGSFHDLASGWYRAAAEEMGVPNASTAVIDELEAFLTPDIRANVSYGLATGVIQIEGGYRFRLMGLPEAKGPYKWFSSNGTGKDPRPNWEYFVQVGEYVRYHQIAAHNGLLLKFEDGNMDLSLYQDGRLVVCCEAKQRPEQLTSLLAGISSHRDGVDFSVPDRGNDALRKAKYLVMFKPRYFALVASGDRRCFTVSYPGERSFRLEEAAFPFGT